MRGFGPHSLASARMLLPRPVPSEIASCYPSRAMRSPRVLAVDVGAGHVACGVFAAGATGRLVLQQFALEPHSSDPSHEARSAVEIAQSLGAIASRQKLTGSSSLAVPGHLALTKFIKTPSVAKEKRDK